MSYNEIQRLQQLAGIITEIRVRTPGVKRDLPIIINSKEEFIKTAKELTIDGYYWRGINNKPLLVSIPKRYPIELFHDDIDDDYRKLTYKTLYPDGRKTRHITEVKVFDPILNKQTLPNLIQLKRNNGIEFVDIDPEIIYNLVEENPGLFGIKGDKSSVFRFVKNLAEKIYDTWEYDDYEKYKNITVGQLIDFIKSNNINEIKVNNPIVTPQQVIDLIDVWNRSDSYENDNSVGDILKKFTPINDRFYFYKKWISEMNQTQLNNLYKELSKYLK